MHFYFCLCTVYISYATKTRRALCIYIVCYLIVKYYNNAKGSKCMPSFIHYEKLGYETIPVSRVRGKTGARWDTWNTFFFFYIFFDSLFLWITLGSKSALIRDSDDGGFTRRILDPQKPSGVGARPRIMDNSPYMLQTAEHAIITSRRTRSSSDVDDTKKNSMKMFRRVWFNRLLHYISGEIL